MIPIDLCTVNIDDFLISYYYAKNYKVVNIIQIVDDLYMKRIGGVSVRRIPYSQDLMLKVSNVKPLNYIERHGNYTDIEFFKLNEDEIQMMMMMEFI